MSGRQTKIVHVNLSLVTKVPVIALPVIVGGVIVAAVSEAVATRVDEMRVDAKVTSEGDDLIVRLHKQNLLPVIEVVENPVRART